jgi:hypothetical protein
MFYNGLVLGDVAIFTTNVSAEHSTRFFAKPVLGIVIFSSRTFFLNKTLSNPIFQRRTFQMEEIAEVL